MPYTERQLQCLSAMGLVAWRLRDELPHGVSSAATGRDVEPAAGAPATSPVVPPSVARVDGSPPASTDIDVSPPPARIDPRVDGSAEVKPTAAESPAEPVPAEVEANASAPARQAVELPPVAEAPPGAEPLAAPALATPLPREPAALAAWLPDQPLAPFSWKERRLTRVGRDDAPILVVVEREPVDALPLEGEATELFERMLGSIGRTRRDTCQCVLATAPEPDAGTVAALAGPARPITLVLVRELDGALDADGCRLPGDPFGGGAWCLPHPDVLLAEPGRKRQAWLVLKTVRSHLPLLP